MTLLSESDAEDRLLVLNVERDRLDRQIADHRLYLELGRRLAAYARNVAADETARLASRPLFSSPRSHGRAILAATADILRETGGPLHARDILEALKSEGFDLPGVDPVAALNTRLWKRSRPQDSIRRLGDAVYALREDAVGLTAPGGS